VPNYWHKVDEEAEDIEEENESNNPFNDGGGVVLVFPLGDAKC